MPTLNLHAMNKFMKDWMEELDDLDIHLNLETDEITEAFENQKAKFQSFLTESAAKLDEKAAELKLSEKATNLRSRLEELQLQLALGKAETRDAFEEQREKLDTSLNEAGTEYKAFKEKAEEQYHHLADEFHEVTEKFRTKMEVLRLQYALAKADMKEEFAEKKVEISQKLQELRNKSEADKEKAEDKWDEFKEEISEAYNNFKETLKGLFS